MSSWAEGKGSESGLCRRGRQFAGREEEQVLGKQMIVLPRGDSGRQRRQRDVLRDESNSIILLQCLVFVLNSWKTLQSHKGPMGFLFFRISPFLPLLSLCDWGDFWKHLRMAAGGQEKQRCDERVRTFSLKPWHPEKRGGLVTDAVSSGQCVNQSCVIN